MYEKYFGIVQIKAYSILFLVFINGYRENGSSTTELLEVSDEVKNDTSQFYFEKANYVMKSNMDSSPVVANSILRFYCACNQQTKAQVYFDRMKSLSQDLYTSSIIDFSELIRSMYSYSVYLFLFALFLYLSFCPSTNQ